MAITIQNNKPVEITPILHDKVNKAFDPLALLQECMVEPLHTQLMPTHPVQIKKGNNPFSDQDIVDTIIKCCDENMDVQAEEEVKELYSQALITYPKNNTLNVKSMFAVQSGYTANLPEPSTTVVYTPAQDIIPISRKFLAGKCDYHTLFATFAYYAKPNTLGFYFANEQAFEDFKSTFGQNMAPIVMSAPLRTQQLIADFTQVKLDGLTESLILRDSDTDENDPMTFARILINQLMNYTTVVSDAEFGIMPFDIAELIRPKSIVFVNIEMHSRASSAKVAEEWKIINTSLQNKIPMVSMNKLTKLTAMQRSIQQIQGMAANAASNRQQQALKASCVPFSQTAPNTINLAKLIKKIMSKMEFVNKSMNSYKCVKSTYARPNRRNPDDFNKAGKTISTKYKPDIHLYIDTSGSISEQNYQDAVKACIAMAKKLNVNLYFNSFSHILSQASKLHTKDKSLSAIYREFQKIPKVTGGTDYELVWDYICRSKKRKEEISILMTDFEYSAPNHHFEHPKNLYYIPCSKMNWNSILHWVEYFTKSMQSQVPDIRKHILF